MLTRREHSQSVSLIAPDASTFEPWVAALDAVITARSPHGRNLPESKYMKHLGVLNRYAWLKRASEALLDCHIYGFLPYLNDVMYT